MEKPPNEDLNEWLAVNSMMMMIYFGARLWWYSLLLCAVWFVICAAVDFFNQVNLLYGSITEFCTAQTCEVMSAGPKYEYQWADGDAVKKPMRLSAPEYMDRLMTWVQSVLDDEHVFPSRVDVPFPKQFLQHVRNIFRRLFRVYAPIYYSHFQKIVSLGEEAHLNTCFKHFYYFIAEFDLVPKVRSVRSVRSVCWCAGVLLVCCWCVAFSLPCADVTSAHSPKWRRCST